MSKEKAVSVPQAANTALAIADYGQFAGSGFEHQTRDDITIPFMGVLQSNSPQVAKNDNARAGMLFNTVTEELVKGQEGIVFVPAVTQHVFVEWKSRLSGGGFVGVHQISSDVVKAAQAGQTQFGKLKVGELPPNTPVDKDPRNDLIETFYVYGVICDGDAAVGMAVIAFTSTKIKVYKKFNTKVRTHLVLQESGQRINPPLFANLTRLRTVADSNTKGDFFNFELVPAIEGDLKKSLLAPTDARFLAALECKAAVESGVARAAFESQSGTGDDGEAGEKKTPF